MQLTLTVLQVMLSMFLINHLSARTVCIKNISGLAIALMFAALPVQAIVLGPQAQAEGPEPVVRELNFMNYQFLDKQRKIADDLLRAKLGRQFTQTRSDMALIQRMIDRGYLDDADITTRQAFGVVLGDVFVDRHKNLNWQVFEDELGASHAVCVDDSSHCIFPITMISRRMEAGLTPNISHLFDMNFAAIQPFLPKLPYTREQ